MLTTYLDPAQLPNQTQEQGVFDNLFAQLIANLPKFSAEWNADLVAFNAGVTAFNSAAAGMAYALPYKIDLTSTADADPGAGMLRFNNASQASATILRLDVAGSDTQDYTKSLDSFDASTSAVKGTLRIVKLGDARKFITFNVTARAAPAGYRNLTVAPVDWSSANPFANGEQVLVFFQRTGDKGDQGLAGTNGANGSALTLATFNVTTNVNVINFLTSFSGLYDRYEVDLMGLQANAVGIFGLRVAIGGAALTAAAYASTNPGGSSQRLDQLQTEMQLSLYNQMSLTSKLTFKNMNQTGDALKLKTIEHRGLAYGPQFSNVSGPGVGLVDQEHLVYHASAVTGFQIYTANVFTAGTVRLVGIRNS